MKKEKPISYDDKLKAYHERQEDLPFDKLIEEDQDRKLKRLAQILKAAAHPVRLRILKTLEDGELSVGMLTYDTSLPYAVVSQHLRYLHQSRLVTRRQEGTTVYYYLNDDRILEFINDRRQ